MDNTEFFHTIAQADKPVIVDFWAPWCGPCKMTTPVLEKLAEEYDRKVVFLTVNADDSREVLAHYRVSGIPTVLAVRDGQVVGRVTGAQNEAGYRAMFDALVEGREVKAPMSVVDRMMRLGAGGLLFMIGVSTEVWLAAGIGAIVAFLGIYDRCPVWAAVTGLFKRR